jgi:putative flippase GtrA
MKNNIIYKLYKKYEEEINYVFIGGCTTLVSIGSYELFNLIGIHHLVSNIISWVLAVTFAYFTNKAIVFKNKEKGLKQVIQFTGSRLVTLGMEEAILYIMIDLLSFDKLITKIIAQVVVFVSNYLFSKFIVFKKSKN